MDENMKNSRRFLREACGSLEAASDGLVGKIATLSTMLGVLRSVFVSTHGKCDYDTMEAYVRGEIAKTPEWAEKDEDALVMIKRARAQAEDLLFRLRGFFVEEEAADVVKETHDAKQA